MDPLELSSKVEILAFSSQVIHALVGENGGSEWLLSAVYGSPEAEERKIQWKTRQRRRAVFQRREEGVPKAYAFPTAHLLHLLSRGGEPRPY